MNAGRPESPVVASGWRSPEQARPAPVLGAPSRAPARPWVRAVFYAFLFCLLFEGASFGIPVKVTTLLGAMLAFAAVSQPTVCLRWPPAAFWLFGSWLYISVVQAIVIAGAHGDATSHEAFVLAQSLVLYWIAFNLMREDRVARGAFVSLAASGVTLGVLLRLGIVHPSLDPSAAGNRYTPFGQNPNDMSFTLSIGLLGLLALAHVVRFRRLRPVWVVWPCVAMLALLIVRYASRGGTVALAAGVLVLMVSGQSVRARVRNAGMAALAALCIVGLSVRDGTLLLRFQNSIRTGRMAGREDIYPLAIGMFSERPYTGWGFVENTYELGSRYREPNREAKDTHNLYLYLLTANGLVGSVPFWAALVLTASAAWKARNGLHGALPLALMATILVANLSSTWFAKSFWVALAYISARGEQAREERLRVAQAEGA